MDQVRQLVLFRFLISLPEVVPVISPARCSPSEMAHYRGNRRQSSSSGRVHLLQKLPGLRGTARSDRMQHLLDVRGVTLGKTIAM